MTSHPFSSSVPFFFSTLSDSTNCLDEEEQETGEKTEKTAS